MVHGKARRIRILIAFLLVFFGVYTVIQRVEDTSDINKVIYPKRLNLSSIDPKHSQYQDDNDSYAKFLLPTLEDYYKERVIKRRIQDFAADVDEPYTMTINNFWSFFPAMNSWCPHPIERIGGIKWNWKWRGEGGKWLCGLNILEQASNFQHDCVVYSYGIEDDTSFEFALLARTNCSVYMFDPTIGQQRSSVQRLLKKYPSRVTFSKVGLGSENFKGEEFSYRTLRAEMKHNQHTFIDVLKMDIEGEEFGVFKNIIEDFRRRGLPFGQLQIEFHVPSLHYEKNLVLWNKFRGWFESLEKAGLRPFMSEPNPISSTKPHDNVQYYEYSFINLRYNHLILRNYMLPG